ncbi:hypothetical protein KKF05_04060 [Patescibacteria group bacterium]|nr:hypothetical protein [Patescibacteria group bacterium]MBU1029224.1 hypothetical protein [Patescibacteria group bacterium]MBU1916099.1 hypothetical protein [Patescibacteria group bacterium]
MSKDFAVAGLTPDQLNSVVEKLGGYEGALKFLRGELVVSAPVRDWREQDGVIHFTVTSDGTTGEEWIARLEGKGFCVSEYAKSVLRSSDFKPMNGLTTRIAVLPGALFTDDDRVTRKIWVDAERRGFTKPNPEVACLIREKFSDDDLAVMGLFWLVTMHEPIEDFVGDSDLLFANRDGHLLGAYYGRLDGWWFRNVGFAFVAPQASPYR